MIAAWMTEIDCDECPDNGKSVNCNGPNPKRLFSLRTEFSYIFSCPGFLVCWLDTLSGFQNELPMCFHDRQNGMATIGRVAIVLNANCPCDGRNWLSALCPHYERCCYGGNILGRGFFVKNFGYLFMWLLVMSRFLIGKTGQLNNLIPSVAMMTINGVQHKISNADSRSKKYEIGPKQSAVTPQVGISLKGWKRSDNNIVI